MGDIESVHSLQSNIKIVDGAVVLIDYHTEAVFAH